MKLLAPFPVSVFIIILLSRVFPLTAQSIDPALDTLTTNFATPNLITFCVQDLKNSIIWYEDVLNCEVDKQQVNPEQKTKLALLSLGDFHIELVQKESSIDIDDTSFGEDVAYICGYKSFGFRVSDFDAYHQFISEKEIPYISEIRNNSFASGRFFVIHDVDQNELVFIEDLRNTSSVNESHSNNFNMEPYWASIVVEDLESEVVWFEENLGFYFYKKFDYENIETRLLLTDGFILELKHYRDKTISRGDVSKESNTIMGLSKLTFEVDNIDMVMSHMNKNNIDLELDLSESEYAWAKKHFLVHDSEDNLIEIVQ